MSKNKFGVSEEAIQNAINEMINRQNEATPESIYQDAMLSVLERNLKNRPSDGSDFDENGAQTMKVCTGF